MIVKPYTRPPAAPLMGLLTADGLVVDEHGLQVDLDDFPATHRVFCSFDTVRALLATGRGEAVCWNGEEIHWRPGNPGEDGWTARRSDVHVLRVPDSEDQLLTLKALCKWRDWLATFGAAPTGTTGSAAWSLLRATLESELRTGEPFSSCPPLRVTVGGRQELGPAGQGAFEGRLEQWDIPAAYATILGSLAYGGRWYRTDELGGPQQALGHAQRLSVSGHPTFVRAIVEIPEMAYGPLPRRPRTARNPELRLMLGNDYPTGKRLQGTWCWEELQQAQLAGARILHVKDVWVHWSTRRPFLPWLAAVEKGREMKGLAGTLAKMTGNALWGRFCMDGRYGTRTIRSSSGGRLVSRRLVFRGGQPPAHDLADTVSGRVRARLYGAMLEAGDRLVSAHTDGLWIARGDEAAWMDGLDGPWRRKQKASRLELLSPQVLRYWPVPARPSAPWTVFAGVPAGQADQMFETEWRRHEQQAA